MLFSLLGVALGGHRQRSRQWVGSSENSEAGAGSEALPINLLDILDTSIRCSLANQNIIWILLSRAFCGMAW